jgi:hypothetical protein
MPYSLVLMRANHLLDFQVKLQLVKGCVRSGGHHLDREQSIAVLHRGSYTLLSAQIVMAGCGMLSCLDGLWQASWSHRPAHIF